MSSLITSDLQVEGPISSGGSSSIAVTSVSANITLDNTESYVNVDASGASRNVTLPTAVGIKGTMYSVKKTDSSVNTVTLLPNGSETIDGSVSVVLSYQYETVTVISDGTNWYQKTRATVSVIDGGSA